MGTFFGKCLWIEKDINFQNRLLEEAKELVQYPCLVSKNIPEGINLISRNKNQIRIIFLSSHFYRVINSDVFTKFKTEYPEIPICLVLHRPEHLHQITDESLGKTVLKQPKKFSDFTHIIESHLKTEYNWKEFSPTGEEKFIELQLEEKKYVETPIKEFLITPKSHFNIFIKIGASKFIKILNAGDETKQEFINSYIEKGVESLYIPQDEHEKYLKLFTNVTKKIVNDFSATNDSKIKQVLSLGTSVAQNLLQTGISPQKLDHAENFLNQTFSVIKCMRMKNSSLKNFLDTIETNNHSATVSFLAGIIANEVGFESSKSVKLVGVAAMFHDIGLFELDPGFVSEVDYVKDENTRIIFEKHAKYGADLLRAAGTFDEVACLAVEQHHLRRRGDGITSIRSNNINLVAEIVAVADDFYNTVLEGGYSHEKEIFFVQYQLKNFSPAIEKALIGMLSKKKSA